MSDFLLHFCAIWKNDPFSKSENVPGLKPRLPRRLRGPCVSGLYDSTIQITFIIYLEIFLILSFFIAQDFVICIFGLKYYYSASKRQRGLSSLSCRPAESAMTINKLDVTPKAENSTFTTLHLCIQLKSSGLKIIIKPQFMKLDLKLL